MDDPETSAASDAEADPSGLTDLLTEGLDPALLDGEIEIEPDPEPRLYTVALSKAVHGTGETRRLDGRTPQTELRFDLSHAETVEALALTLSLDPLPGVDPQTPVYLQFNGSNPVEIDPRGQGLDRRIELDPGRARETGNVVRLSHPAECSVPGGGYDIALNASRLEVSVLPRDQRLQLREAEARFASPTFAPQTVGLVASGDNRTKLQALAAQGMGVRLQDIPEFRLSAGESDFDLIMVPRSQLADYTTDPAILDATGPSIILPNDRNNRLFLTGDTQADVMASVRAFASAFLPDTRRSDTTPEDVLSQNPLDADRKLVETIATLDLLTVQTGHAREFVFDVADPAASTGNLILYLNRGRQTRKGTRLSARLNGVALGEAVVRGRRMTVSYPIRKGLLLGTANRLELTTHEADPQPRCNTTRPFIAISEGSELRLTAETPTPDSDLSRFAADGSLFSAASGADTTLILPERDADYVPALAIVAKLAQASGRGWAEAEFARGYADPDERHRLIIEPQSDIEREVRLGAPRGLQSVWRSRNFEDDTIRQFASLDGEDTVRQAASLIREIGPVEPGGVAAIYPSDTGKLIGVISNTGGIGFAAALQPLSTDDHWNGLKGAVSRWNRETVTMAQAALPMPQFSMPELDMSESALHEASTTQSEAVDALEDMPSGPSLSARVWSWAAQIQSVDWPDLRPGLELSTVRTGIDQHWGTFSEMARNRTQIAGRFVDDALHSGRIVAATLPGSLQSASQESASKQRLNTLLQTARDESAAIQATLWHHLDIPEQTLSTARLGQAQTLPAIALLAALFFMVLIGMLFASPPKAGRLTRSRL